jgi:hypothetical protein
VWNFFNYFFLLLLFGANQKKIHTKRSASDAVRVLPRSASEALKKRFEFYRAGTYVRNNGNDRLSITIDATIRDFQYNFFLPVPPAPPNEFLW